jgi:hypothetical protein
MRATTVHQLSIPKRVALQVYRLDSDGQPVRVAAGMGPVYCAEIDAYLLFCRTRCDEPWVRISRDAAGRDLVPTADERADAQGARADATAVERDEAKAQRDAANERAEAQAARADATAAEGDEAKAQREAANARQKRSATRLLRFCASTGLPTGLFGE